MVSSTRIVSISLCHEIIYLSIWVCYAFGERILPRLFPVHSLPIRAGCLQTPEKVSKRPQKDRKHALGLTVKMVHGQDVTYQIGAQALRLDIHSRQFLFASILSKELRTPKRIRSGAETAPTIHIFAILPD
jgi:hypothetical protein